LYRYHLKLLIAENKRDEFVDSLRFLSGGIRAEDNCLDFSLYRDIQGKDAYIVLAEWKTRQAMEAHFKHNNFSVLIGAAKVLGKDFEISIDETLEKGSFRFAREKIKLKQI